jgi:hypothetical protein
METPNKSAFYGEQAQLCDAGIHRINALALLILAQKFLHLLKQRFPRASPSRERALMSSPSPGH